MTSKKEEGLAIPKNLRDGQDVPPDVSPCIGVCRLDDNQVCIGCYRTADEIFEAGITYLARQKG